LLVLTFTTLGGCATYERRPLVAADELAALNRRELPPPQAIHVRMSQSDQPSESRFDPSDGLNDAELVAVALRLNPDLIAARAAIGESEALLVTARLFPNPEFGLGYGAGVGGTPGYTADLELLFELLRWGERDARVAAAGAVIAVTRAEVLAMEYDTAALVRQRSFDVLAADQVLALLEEEVRLRTEALNLLRGRRDVGEGTSLEVSAAELELAEIQRDLRLIKIEVEQARLALNAVVGLPSTPVLQLEQQGKPLTIPFLEDMSEEQVSERILTARLDLRASEARYEVAEQELRLAISRQYPRIKIGPTFSHEGDAENYAGVGVTIELPVFDRNQGEIAEKEAARDRVRAEFISDLHRIQSEAMAALAKTRAVRNEVEIQQREVLPLLERSQSLFREALQDRELIVLDWIAAEQRALRTRRAYLDTLVDYRRALLDLEALTGFPIGTFDAPSASSKEPDNSESPHGEDS